MRFLLLIFLPSLSFASCTLSDLILQLRPNSQWTMIDNKYANLTWLDASAKPTALELQNALSTCQTNQAARLALKQQARLDVKNTSLTPAQRIQAILILQDLDN